MITSRPRGSRNMASSSLTIKARMRPHMSAEPLARAARRKAQKHSTSDEQYRDVAQEERPDVAGQEHRLQAGDQITGRHDGADPLDQRRHRADFEQEAGQQKSRQEGGEQSQLRGEELVAGRRRDEQALAERRQEKGS